MPNEQQRRQQVTIQQQDTTPVTYLVTRLMNRLSPRLGAVLTGEQTQMLIAEKAVTVQVV